MSHRQTKKARSKSENGGSGNGKSMQLRSPSDKQQSYFSPTNTRWTGDVFKNLEVENLDSFEPLYSISQSSGDIDVST